jgi:hypothetical protein
MFKMPCQKYLVMLYLFETLANQRSLNKEAFLCELDLSDVSFKRYLACLREYFLYAHPTWRIIYHRKNERYELYIGKEQ